MPIGMVVGVAESDLMSLNFLVVNYSNAPCSTHCYDTGHHQLACGLTHEH